MPSSAPFDAEQWRIAVEGLSAIAITSFEMKAGSGQARGDVLEMWDQLGRPPGMLKAAAENVSASPQPVLETAGETERARRVREMLGVVTAEDALVAMLSARALLDELGAEFDG